MKIGVIPLVADNKGGKEAKERAKSILGCLKKSFQLKEIAIDNANEADILVVFIKSGGTEYLFEKIAPKLKETGKPLTLLSMGSHNSLPAAMEILSWANRQGFKNCRLLHGSPDELEERLEERVRHLEILETLTHTNIGVLGKPSDWLIASDVDYTKAGRRWGITLVDIPLEEVVENIKSLGTKDVTKALPSFPPARFMERVEPKDIGEAVKVYLGIKKAIKDHNLSAVTLRCFDIIKALNDTGCLALAKLNDEGIPAGCEGDIPALFTLMLNGLITGKPAFMANPSRIDGDRIHLSHCTVPLSMVKSFAFKTHFESDLGVAVAGRFEKGPITLSKIGGPALDEFYVDEGVLTANIQDNCSCRTHIVINLNNGPGYFFRNPLGNHHIVAQGHHGKRIKEIMDFEL